MARQGQALGAKDGACALVLPLALSRTSRWMNGNNVRTFMGKLFSLIVVLALGYAGIYVYYGHAVKQEVQQELDNRGLSTVSVDNVEYGLLAPISTSANITLIVAYRGAEAALDLAVQGHPVFSDEVSVEFDGLQALRLGIGFGQSDD
tara:strand:- start:1437 stop:1880 length:444 start_codon:yes stop_codon:yes gene_type:complete